MSADHPDPDELLAAAIRAHADTIDDHTDGRYSLLDSYAIIACWAPTEDTGGHAYTLHYHSPTVPTHVALGLFDHAVQLVANEVGDE